MTGLVLRARRMSAKLFNCTPAQLPADLKANLVTMLQCGVNALEGYIRPGCVHLVRLETLNTQKPWVVQCGVTRWRATSARAACTWCARPRAAPLHGLPVAPRAPHDGSSGRPGAMSGTITHLVRTMLDYDCHSASRACHVCSILSCHGMLRRRCCTRC